MTEASPQRIFKQGDRVRLLEDKGAGTLREDWTQGSLLIQMDQGTVVIIPPDQVEHLTVIERLGDLAP